jgi:glycosyltransferase involved in cell wall biosynthesis
MSRQRVTILVCAAGGGAALVGALESALVQTAARRSYRVLVVDDAGIEDAAAVLRRFRPAGVDVLQVAGLSGADAVNAGLEHVTTPAVVRLGADERLEPEAIDALLDRADRTGADVVSCDRWDGGRLRLLTEPPALGDVTATGTLLPADLVRAVGGWRDVRRQGADLLLRLVEELGCTRAHVPQPLFSRRAREDEAAGVEELRTLWPEATLARHGLAASVEVVAHGL